MFKVKSNILFLICIFYIGYIEPGIVRIDTIKTEDGKKITFLADDHGMNLNYQEQMDAILDLLYQREKINEPTHVLVEQPASWLERLGSNAKTLLYLPKQIKREKSKLTLTTYENVEVRRISAAAHDMANYPVSFFDNWPIEGTQKTLGTFTFQDILDEYEHVKQSFADYYLQQDSTMVQVYKQCITLIPVNSYYEKLLHIIKNKNISLDTRVLEYVKNSTLQERSILKNAVLYAFVSFVDLNIIRAIQISPCKNMIVVAGGWHTYRVRSALSILNTSSLYYAGIDVAEREEQKELSSDQIRQSLFAQKQSLQMGLPIKAYVSTIMSRIIMLAVCYWLYTSTIHTNM